MDVIVLVRDSEESFAAIGPVATPEAAEQIRQQVEERGWGSAPRRLSLPPSSGTSQRKRKPDAARERRRRLSR